MPAEIRATIAQISDLHINRKVRREITDSLKSILRSIDPNILIVSGDLANQPLPWQMKKAARLLREIEKEIQNDLQPKKPRKTIVIPGNHDFKFWGNVGLRRLTRIPFEIYFRRDGLELSWLRRFWLATKLTFNALWWNGRQMREETDLFVDKDLGLAIFTINSNTLTEMMAAGKVEAHDLQRLYEKVRELDELRESEGSAEIPEGAFFYKIAVVHHHPAPIADAPFEAFDRLADSFMIFYNAGLFVRELSRRGFNLVLHGHRHVAGFLRVACELPDRGRTELPISAAGTASHPAPDDHRGHHLNVVTIFDDDTANLDQWFFSANVVRKEESHIYNLDTLDDVRRRRKTIFRNSDGYYLREVRKTVKITRDGYSCIELEHKGCTIVASKGIRCIPVFLTTERPYYLRGVEKASGPSPFAVLRKTKDHGIYKFVGEFDLAENHMPYSGAFDFAYHYRLVNAHVLSSQEFIRHYGETSQQSEFASETCNYDCELLTLKVEFPDGYDVKAMNFWAVAEYVTAPLQGTDDDRFDRGQSSQHDEETERIKDHGRFEGNGYRLTCPQPIPGMIYKLYWTFPEDTTPAPSLTVAARVAEARGKLLHMGASQDTAAHQDRAWAQKLLMALASDINIIVDGPKEEFQISVMVFDEADRCLKYVAASQEPIPRGKFFSGEGCAGFAFEKARGVLYHPARQSDGYFIHAEEWPNPDELLEPVVLASFPWVYNPGQGHHSLVLGVINLSSMLPTTKLLGLFDAPDSKRASIMKKIQDSVNFAATFLMKL